MTDHDAIAARVRQDRGEGTLLSGPVYIKLADMADAYLDLYDEVQRLRAEKDAKQVKRTIPAGQTPLDDKLNHRFLDVIQEGEAARDAGTASPYHGHSLEHCLHATGWVMRDLRLALDEARARTEKAESERDALRAHPYLPAEEIAAIERGNRRWHGEYDTTVSVRWEPYKPDGQRQMKAKGRWQTMTFNSSDYFRWENCNRPAQVRQALKGDSDE